MFKFNLNVFNVLKRCLWYYPKRLDVCCSSSYVSNFLFEYTNAYIHDLFFNQLKLA